MDLIDSDAFEEIALGEASPAQALSTIRKWGAGDDEAFGQYVYVALKELTLRLVATRIRNEVAAWGDVIRQSSALLKGRGDQVFGERLLTLSDLAADWERLCEADAHEALLERPYVQAILEAIHARGGQAKRADVAKVVGVRDANFSRILRTLEMAGLVSRDKLRERTLTLTAEGRDLVATEDEEELVFEFDSEEHGVLDGACVVDGDAYRQKPVSPYTNVLGRVVVRGADLKMKKGSWILGGNAIRDGKIVPGYDVDVVSGPLFKPDPPVFEKVVVYRGRGGGLFVKGDTKSSAYVAEHGNDGPFIIPVVKADLVSRKGKLKGR
jgi:DNA-binding MarR family transcriptional regulator